MQKDHAKAIKGMSIACIVLSGLAILACIVGIAAMGAIGDAVREYGLDYDYYDLDGHYDSIFGMYGLGDSVANMHWHGGYGELGGYGGHYDDMALFQLGLGFVNALLVFGIVAEAVCLAAGILALRNYNKPGKFGLVFGWSIAGAVLGFLGAGFVQCVLFIIIAVFVNSDKKLYAAGMYSPSGTVAYQQQPMPVPPAGPAAAPVQPVSAPAPQPQPELQPSPASGSVVPVAEGAPSVESASDAAPASASVAGAVEPQTTVVVSEEVVTIPADIASEGAAGTAAGAGDASAAAGAVTAASDGSEPAPEADGETRNAD